MSNLIINWRFWIWHLQVVQRGDWRSYRAAGLPLITWTRNDFHLEPDPSLNWPPLWRRPVAFYEGKRYAIALALIVGALLWWIL